MNGRIFNVFFSPVTSIICFRKIIDPSLYDNWESMPVQYEPSNVSVCVCVFSCVGGGIGTRMRNLTWISLTSLRGS